MSHAPFSQPYRRWPAYDSGKLSTGKKRSTAGVAPDFATSEEVSPEKLQDIMETLASPPLALSLSCPHHCFVSAPVTGILHSCQGREAALRILPAV